MLALQAPALRKSFGSLRKVHSDLLGRGSSVRVASFDDEKDSMLRENARSNGGGANMQRKAARRSAALRKSSVIADAAAEAAVAETESRSKRLLFLVSLVMLVLFLCLVAGFVLTARTQHDLKKDTEQKKCADLRDAIAGWAAGLRDKAALVCTMMQMKKTTTDPPSPALGTCAEVCATLSCAAFSAPNCAYSETLGCACEGCECGDEAAPDSGLPFLVPDDLLFAAIQAAMSVEFRRKGAVNSRAGTLTGVAWMTYAPRVEHEDSAVFEAYITDLYGFDVRTGAEPSDGAHAPTDGKPNHTFPLSHQWGAFGKPPGAPNIFDLAGLDVAESLWRDFPAPFYSRVFYEGRILAAAPRDGAGNAVADTLFVTMMPYCGLSGCSPGAEIFGILSFSLPFQFWVKLFPEHVEVNTALDGSLLKSVDFTRFTSHVTEHEPFTDLLLRCHYVELKGFKQFEFWVWIGSLGLLACATTLAGINCWHIRRRAVQHRNERARRAAERLQREREALQAVEDGARVAESERTDRYLSHEFKNRLIILEDLCARLFIGEAAAADALLMERHGVICGIIDELFEVTTRKSALLHLANGKYVARPEATDLASVVSARVARFKAGADVEFSAAADARYTLLVDVTLVAIVVDNLLLNALKYGASDGPTTVALDVERLANEAGAVSVRVEVRNPAGVGHDKLLALGEEELNRVARLEGGRLHEGQEARSGGDGFPMAYSSAAALGGTLRLSLVPQGVVATLALPRVLVDASASFEAVRLRDVTVALVDDSAFQRKLVQRQVERTFPTHAKPLVAGENAASIDDFAAAVCAADCDLVLVDQNFDEAHTSKAGTDVVREIRRRDSKSEAARRAILVISANDSPDDIRLYKISGADGYISKGQLTPKKLHMRLCQFAVCQPRFNGRVTYIN